MNRACPPRFRRGGAPALLSALVSAAILLTATTASAVVTRNIDLKAHFDDYPQPPGQYAYSACWCYLHGDGREYAAIGTYTGTAIYNVTDPSNVHWVGFIPGPQSIWREMKSYRNWLYIVTEGVGAGEGLQVVRMTNPEAPVLAATYTGAFNHSHTVAVDTARAILICNGTRNGAQATGMRILSIASPESPVEIGWWPGGSIPVSSLRYIHDSVPIGNRLYGSSIDSWTQRVFDFTTPATPIQLDSMKTTGRYCHNGWPDKTGKWLYSTVEIVGEPLNIFDISNLATPALANAITCNPGAIIHNAHVKGDELYLSNYTEGIRILDVTDPAHPAEFAYADSWPGPSGDFHGVWEVCPFFPSGTVIASDMETGLYVYRPQRNYGLIRVVVRDAATHAPIPGCVAYSDAGDSLTTPADGIVQFAADPGARSVTVRRLGTQVGPIARSVTVGSRDTVVVDLPTVTFTGTVLSAVDDSPLEDAEIHLNATASAPHTAASGAFSFTFVPGDQYQVTVRRPGFVPLVETRTIDAASSDGTFRLRPTTSWDALESPSFWTVGGAGTGDNATSGQWVRVEPLGTGRSERAIEGAGSGTAPAPEPAGDPGKVVTSRGRIPGGFGAQHEEAPEAQMLVPGTAQPEFDRTPPPGQFCFVTGQGTDPANLGEADVDNGKTSLTSPAFDLSGMTDPVIGYWRWFYTNAPTTPEDWIAVLLSNNGGVSWVAVDTTRGLHNGWEEKAIIVKDYITPTISVKVRFVAADFGGGSVVEAAVDDIVTYDASLPSAGVPDPVLSRLALLPPRPNPARTRASLSLRLPRAGPVQVDVLDLTGRRVRQLYRAFAPAGRVPLEWDGLDDRGQSCGAGLYFVVARAGGERAISRLAWLR